MTAHLHRSDRPVPGLEDYIPRIDGQIRPGLRKAFPLPVDDERFDRLLDALAGRGSPVVGSRPSSHP
ncbi:hypothetical protein [Rubellimicrobium roseum]|uniref:Uncharacterized protein n=1 Tax=Rubellimicrobium roseum TaxID=687525 RepID=A0A5C4NHV5_9RHOB|nr:hypothetical protein [Rubellimicrobium roseum]TNC72009.1 hypothetical protein FHG71_09755 [Rubellimicrobium roseum]